MLETFTRFQTEVHLKGCQPPILSAKSGGSSYRRQERKGRQRQLGVIAS
jgi:hypothetical protein